jgi:hypothetical protein
LTAPAEVGWPWRASVFLISGGSIAALLADVYGVAPMWLAFCAVSLPSMALLVVLAVQPRVPDDLRRRIRVGAFAGLIGTIGYDIVRIPFAVAGQRVFAPIDSYGILVANAVHSSGLTATVGWLYHLSNGVTFGIAYAALAARRHWLWGVAWGLILESAAILSPFAVRYGIAGQALPIAIAYGAHVFYGAPLGLLVQRIDQTDAALRRVGRYSVVAVLVVAVLAVVGAEKPWIRSAGEIEAADARGEVLTIVTGDRFEPEWSRIKVGECLHVANRTGTTYETPLGTVAPQATSPLCFDKEGVFRVRLGTRPYSGGFVIVQRA